MLQHAKRQVKLLEVHCFAIFMTALSVIFLTKPRWPKNKSVRSVMFSLIMWPWLIREVQPNEVWKKNKQRLFFYYNVQNTKFYAIIFIDVTWEKSEHIFMYTICINTGVKRNRLIKYCRVLWSYIVPLIINGRIYTGGSLRHLRRLRRLRRLV